MDLVSKISSIRKLLRSRWWIQVSQIPIFTWKAQTLSQATNTISCFPWSDKFICLFSRKSLPNIHEQHVHLVCQAFFQENRCCLHKAACQPTITTITQCFSWIHPQYPGTKHMGFICTAHFLQRMLKRHKFKNGCWIKLILHPGCSLPRQKGFVLFFYWEFTVVENKEN
jgi:hypothetical protein